MSPELDKFGPAFVKFQQEVRDPRKDSLNPHFKNKFVSLEDTIEAVRPALNKHGFTLSQWRVGKGLTTLILHESGQYIYGEAEMVLEKMTPQAVGSATTYERRYGALGATGTSGDVDDDAELAHGREPETEKAAPSKYWKPVGETTSKPKEEEPPQEGPSPDELKQVDRFVSMIGTATKIPSLEAVGAMIKASPLSSTLKAELKPFYADRLHELEAER
jgi:hypothetical protein